MGALVWLPVEGWPYYEVSSEGEVRSSSPWAKRPLMKLQINSVTGYKFVKLCKKGDTITILVHILVAKTFIGPCPDGQEVRHKNGVKVNCAADNLEYGTHRQNVLDRWKHDAWKGAPVKKVDENQVLSMLYAGKSLREIAKYFCVSAKTISNIKNGVRFKSPPTE